MHDRLGIPVDQVEVVHGDTALTPFGMGTYGSRSLAVGGSAMAKAMDKLVDKGRKIAAHKLEAAEDDIGFDNGVYSVAGTDKQVSFGEVVFAAYVPHDYPEGVEPGMEESAFYDPANFTFPAGTHVCEVEVDPDTGGVEIVNWACVDDFGRIVNPMVVEGQVHGGVAHGVGQALLEHSIYDGDGQLLTGSYMDYAMPRADNLPQLKLDTIETLCPHNPLGVKGAARPAPSPRRPRSSTRWPTRSASPMSKCRPLAKGCGRRGGPSRERISRPVQARERRRWRVMRSR